ncbi:methionyl-tRNA formyltransferase [Lotmaria passim]
MLRIPCTFTQVTNPTLVPSCVQAELAEVERGGDRCCGYRPAAPLSGRRVRFYRAPPAIFRSLLSTRGTAHDNAEEGKKEEGSTLRRMAARRERGGSRGCGANASAADEGADKKEEAAKMGKKHRGVKAATQQPDEPAEDEEAPEDYVPDVIHAAPPTEHRWHIPPGTGYFPESDESYGAIKCKDGWFLWKEAHMNRANKAQPAVLIRKGLAMKTGVLYVGLFSEYS